MVNRFKGNKFGASTVKNAPDTLRSEDTVEILLGISEGPIVGLENGPQSFFIGDTPLVNQSGENNFDKFELIEYNGSAFGEDIKSRLGGFSSSISVNTSLASNVAVTRQTTLNNMDFLEVRLVIRSLYNQKKDGTSAAKLELKLEYKAQSDPNWSVVYPSEIPSEYPEGTRMQTSTGDRLVYWQDTQPSTTLEGSIWADTNLLNIRMYQGSSWQAIAGITYGADYISWPETDFNGNAVTRRLFKDDNGKLYKPIVGDIWIFPGGFIGGGTQNYPTLIQTYNGSSWIEAGSTISVPDSTPTVDGVMTITGKTTSPYVKEIRWAVPQIAEPYQIRITKLSPDSDQTYVNDVLWESIQEVTAKTFNWENLAVTQLIAKASDQFTSVPETPGVRKGRILKVPSNYNAETRTYTGAWDGTFQLAYTDNPAWVAYDIVDNASYGMNAYYPVVADKWDLYEIAQWCDEMVEDEVNNSTRPRFTFNDYIQEARDARELLTYVCGTFAGRWFDDGNGTIRFKVDRDTPAVAVFAPENVADGEFNYTRSEITSRYNDITVTFINPELDWQEDRRRVYDQNHIDTYGRIPDDFIAVACTNESEALARGRYRLVTSTTERETVQFQTNRQGIYLEPYDVILVCDPAAGTGISRRVLEVPNVRRIRVRDAVTFEPGFQYQVSLFYPNPDYPATSDQKLLEFVSNVDHNISFGTTTLIRVVDLLPDNIVDYVFTISEATQAGTPKPYRVMTIEEAENNPDDCVITALEVNRTKWSYIDGETPTPTIIDYSNFATNAVLPISNLRVTSENRPVADTSRVVLTLEWDKSPTKLVRQYQIMMSYNDGPFSEIGVVADNIFETEALSPGNYTFSIFAIHISGRKSVPVQMRHTLSGEFRYIAPVTNLRMIDEPSTTIFESMSPTFRWNKGDGDAFHAFYRVRIRNAGNDAVLRTEDVTTPIYVYDYAKNIADNSGTPSRTVKISVSRVDQFDDESDQVSLTVTNEAPAAPSPVNTSVNDTTAIISIPKPTINDFAGMRVHMSNTSGFTADSGNEIYAGPNTSLTVNLPLGQVSYFRVAAYDKFSDENLNYAPQFSLNPGALDTTPPAQVTNTSVSGAFRSLKITWTNPPDADFDHVEIWLNTSTFFNTADLYATTGAEYENIGGLNADQTYYVWIISVDTSGNQSLPKYAGTASTRLLVADDLANAAVTVNKLANGAVSLTKFASGLQPVSIVSVLPNPVGYTGPNVVFNTTDKQLYRYENGAWVKVVNITDVQSEISNATIEGDQLANLIIDETNFAATLEPIKVVTSLPNPVGYTGPDLVYLTNPLPAKLYRYDSSVPEWDLAIDTSGLSGFIGANQIAANTINANHIVADSINTGHIQAGAVQADQIDAGAVTADKIGADSILASRIFIMDWNNLVPDGFIVDEDAWVLGGDWTGPIDWTANNYRSRKIFTFTNPGGSGYSSQIVGRKFPVLGDKKYYISGQAHAVTGTQFRPRFILRWYDSTGAVIGSNTGATSTVVGTTFTTFEGELTAPSNAREAQFIVDVDLDNTDGNVRVGGFFVKQMTGTTLIEDDSITTGKIVANNITSALIASNAIQANHISTNSIYAGAIQAGAVSTTQLDANAVTADKIASGTIVASKLAITRWENIVPDGAHVDAGSWTMNAGWAGPTPWTGHNYRSSGVFTYTYPGGTGIGSNLNSEFFLIDPDQKYYMSVQHHPVTGTTTRNIRLVAVWYDETQTLISSEVISSGVETGSFATQFGIATSPANARWMRIRINVDLDDTDGDVRVGGLYVRPQTGAVLIEDGAITADKISVANLGAISANIGNVVIGEANIEDLSVTTIKLNGNAVTRDKVFTGAVTDFTLMYDAGPFTVSSTTWTTIGTSSITLTDMDLMYPIILSYSASIKTSVAGQNVNVRLIYRLDTGSGYSAWAYLPNSELLIADGVAYLQVSKTFIFPAEAGSYQFRFQSNVESTNEGTVRDLYIKPLAIRK